MSTARGGSVRDEAGAAADAPPLADLVDHLQEVVFHTDARGRWTFLSRAWSDLTGFPVPSCLGRAFLEYVHPDDREEDLARFRPLVERKKDSCRHVVRYLTREGGHRHVEVWARLVLDEQGTAVGTAGTLTDVTDRVRAQEALLRRAAILQAVAFTSQRLLREGDIRRGMDEVLARLGEAAHVSRVYVFENHPDELGRLATSQRHEWCAPGIEPQLANPQLQSLPYDEAGFARWPPLLARGEALCGHVAEFPASERALLESHEIRALAVVPVFVAGSWWGLIGFDDCERERDWSAGEIEALLAAAGTIGAALERERVEHERRASLARAQELEQLRQVDALKTQFINTAAHELGTPLTPIKIQIHLLRQRAALGPEHARGLDVLERNVDRLALLVADILDGARLQGGRLRVTPRRLALPGLVADAVESFAAVAHEQGVRLAMEEGADATVVADDRRLAQVLYNLLSNALKFTHTGGEVRVRVDRVAGEAVVRVQDDGVGLTEEQRERLFRPFSQVHDTSHDTRPGTGLGLFISRGIVEHHGGRMWVESDGPGKGSTFAFALPLA